MRAVELKHFGLEGLAVGTREVQRPGAGEVLVKMHAASINYHDLATILGMANPRLAFPVVPLSDGAGEIVEVGEGVTDFSVGDRVASLFFQGWNAGEPTRARLSRVTGETTDGVLQEYWRVKTDGIIKVPDYLNYQEVATLPCAALTAWRAVVVEGKVKAGDKVLIQGTGGVSIFALQFCKLLGAETIVISSSQEKLEKAQALGADHLVNYKEHPEWFKPVKALSGGEGVDLVVEVGGSGTLVQSLRSVRIGGHVSMIGVLTGVANTVPTAMIMAMNVAVKGITVAHQDDFKAMLRAMQQAKLKPQIGEVFGFEECAKAISTMQAAKHFGKIVLDYAR
ncbi:MAG TPA: NAD(P)-dependent alcohol dehydrogenase [Pseudomonadales bacterium]|nr:NAD(P)-dependent alcohol dehydrogenase [Pseudomonadales bacterium]